MTEANKPRFYPVSSPDIGALEEQYVSQAVRSGWVSSIGEFVDRFEAGFAKVCGSRHGVAVSNGTDAIFLALKALGVGPGDEVIVPALTFVAVPAVVLHVGAEPVLVDVDARYWGLDPAAVDKAFTPRTRAVVAVHLYGHPVDMNPLLEMAAARGVAVIEDCAEAHGAAYRGRTVGSMGRLGCFSFYGNKVITTGEGGVVTTDDDDLAERVRFIKDHAMDKERRYFHPEAGYNCRMTNMQAALGCAQLERMEELLHKRARLLGWYERELADLEGLTLNPKMPWAEPVNWIVCGVLSAKLAPRRDALLVRLRELGVDTRPFFVPAYHMPPYAGCRRVGADGGVDLPGTDQAGAAGFNLPTVCSLTEQDVKHIGAQVRLALAEVTG